MSALLERIAADSAPSILGRPQSAPERPRTSELRQGKGEAETLHTANLGASGRKQRRSNGLHIEELQAELPPPVPLKRKKRPKVVYRTTRPTDEQEKRFGELMERLEGEGYDFSRSELERTMYDLFLALGLRGVVLAAQRNRERELAEGYGTGRM